MARYALRGVLLAFALSIPVMSVCALTIGIPVPFAGWMRGGEWALQSAEVLFFLSLLWAGLPLAVIALLGALSGVLAAKLSKAGSTAVWLGYTILFAAMAEFLAVGAFYVVDRLFGPI
jgi:hypothetical protein